MNRPLFVSYQWSRPHRQPELTDTGFGYATLDVYEGRLTMTAVDEIIKSIKLEHGFSKVIPISWQWLDQ